MGNRDTIERFFSSTNQLDAENSDILRTIWGNTIIELRVPLLLSSTSTTDGSDIFCEAVKTARKMHFYGGTGYRSIAFYSNPKKDARKWTTCFFFFFWGGGTRNLTRPAWLNTFRHLFDIWIHLTISD